MTDFGTITSARPVLLVGCGKMGGAMLRGWLERGLDAGAIRIVDPFPDYARKMAPQMAPEQFVAEMTDLPAGLSPSFVILAVKPQMMAEALASFAHLECEGSTFLSIAAGKTIGSFEKILGARAVIRAMPNTPAAIGKGITVCCANGHVSDAQKNTCQALLSAVGQVEWVADEALIDAVTAVSGSGPAYVFHLVEAMAAAGEKVGLSPELAAKLAAATVSGAGALLEESQEDATTLRVNVTSPKGTTEAALNVLMAEPGGLTELMTKAIEAAHTRSEELAD